MPAEFLPPQQAIEDIFDPVAPADPPVVAGEPAPYDLAPDASPLQVAGVLLRQQQIALLRHFQAAPEVLSRETFAREMTLVARLALVDGDYKASVKAYEVAGQHIGALTAPAERHLHLHNTGTSTAGQPLQLTEFARASDDELHQILAEARQVREAQEVTVTNALPAR